MENLDTDDIQSMARAIGISIVENDLVEVMHTVNAMLTAVDSISVPGFELIEPLPVLKPTSISGPGLI